MLDLGIRDNVKDRIGNGNLGIREWVSSRIIDIADHHFGHAVKLTPSLYIRHLRLTLQMPIILYANADVAFLLAHRMPRLLDA